MPNTSLLIQSDIYETMRRNLTGKIALDEQIVVNLVREIEPEETGCGQRIYTIRSG